ncbi:MAG: hypothetical protein J2P37_13435, partial [Ktedonobacteraceae bacterium]|nr:hypothetical protein [Ktedonobacteraceae bacterium]
LQGELIQRGDERYDAARKVYNAMIDKPPLLIVRCADVADVLAAVNFGRENKRQTHHLGFTPSISLHVNTTSRPSCIHFSSSTWQQVIPLRDDTFLPSF